MESNQNIRRCHKESVKKLVKALRLQSSIFNLYIFLEDHLEVFSESRHKETLITLSVWLTTFNLLLEENRREWEEIEDQLGTLEGIHSIDQWLEIRQSLLEPSFWNNCLERE